MENESEQNKQTAEITAQYSLRNLDEETIQILLDDMIATGG